MTAFFYNRLRSAEGNNTKSLCSLRHCPEVVTDEIINKIVLCEPCINMDLK